LRRPSSFWRVNFDRALLTLAAIRFPLRLENANGASIPLMAFTQHWKLARVLPTFAYIAVGA
jgi:hypothetical protein